MSSWGALLRRGHLGTEADRATYRTLHTAAARLAAAADGPDAGSRREVAQAPAHRCSARRRGDDRHRPACSPGTAAVRTTPTSRPSSRPARSPTGARPSSTAPTSPAPSRRACVRQAIVAPLDVDEQVVGTLQVFTGRRLGGARPGHRRGGPLGLRTARARRARRLAHPPHGGRGPGPARPDQPALHLQLAHRHRVVHPHRPRTGPRAAPRPRRVHPLLLPAARRVHDARRGAALHRAPTSSRAGAVRRPPPRDRADRAGGAAGRRAVPVPAAARRERRPARHRGPSEGQGEISILAQDADHEAS